MKNIFKIIALILVTAISLTALFACGTNSEESKGDTSASSGDTSLPSSSEAKFGIILQIENGAFTDMRDGIKEALVEAGYPEASVVVKCAQGDMTALSTICTEMDDGSYTAVFTIGTAATQTFVNLDSETPCFFCSVSDPIAAKVVTDFAAPDKNATGTSNAIPVSDIFELADTLTPGIEKYGIIYCTSQTNAVSTANSAKEYLNGKGSEPVVKAITDSTELQAAVESMLSEGVDAVFVPNDQIVQSAISVLTELCIENKIPTYCSSATTVASGCFATLAIDDIGIGKQTVSMALEYLKNGKKISEIPTVVVGIDYCSVNESVREALGVEIPEDLAYEVNLIK